MAESTPAVPVRIFLNYRREEAEYAAGWLDEHLVARYGRDQVFTDVASIQGGEDYAKSIINAVRTCEVLLALIGRQWLTITDEAGRRRLFDDPKDLLRREIEAALDQKVRVIPILVGNARMPRAEQLPASLAKLADRQALDLSPKQFKSNIGPLLSVIDETLARPQVQRETEEETKREADAKPKSPDATTVGEDERHEPFNGPVGREPPTQPHWRQYFLVDHARKVRAVGFSPDGQLLVTGSDDSTAKVRDLNTGHPVAPLQDPLQHEAPVTKVVFSPVQRLIATMGGKTVRLWKSSAAGEPLTHESNVTDVAFSPDGRLIATCCERVESDPHGTVRLWDLASGKERPLSDPVPFGRGIAFHPDGTLLATASLSKGVQLWDLSSGREITRFWYELKDEHGLTDVYGLTFSPRGTLLAAGSKSKQKAEQKAWVWDIKSQRSKSFRHDQDNDRAAFSPAFSPDGRLLATLAFNDEANHEVEVWGIASERRVAALPHEGPVIRDLAFSPDGRLLATAGSDGQVRLWDFAAARMEDAVEHKNSVVAVAFSPDGALLASAGFDNCARVWVEGDESFPEG